MSQFKAMKFRVENEEHSKKIQEHLFSLGYKWRNWGKTCENLTNCVILSDDRGMLTWDAIRYSDNYSHKEYKLKELVTYELEEVKEEFKISVNITVNGRAVDQALVAVVETLIKNAYIEVQGK